MNDYSWLLLVTPLVGLAMVVLAVKLQQRFDPLVTKRRHPHPGE